MSEVAVNQNNGMHPLDSLTWNALTGRQRLFAVGNDSVLRFQPDVAPFAAMIDMTPASFDMLLELAKVHGPVALTTPEEVKVPAGFSVLRQAMLVQMVCEREPEQVTLDYVRLDATDVPDMLSLTTMTQPGPFGPGTIELGDYLGIRSSGKLIAMAGERLGIDGYTEISAVCVDPAFRGRGLATGLMTVLIKRIRARGDTPLLHVLTSNRGAISVYHSLGFVERREFHLTILDAFQT